MEAYNTLSEAINALRMQGYTTDFNLQKTCIVCQTGKYNFNHNEFQIDKSFRFDVDENPADQSVLYAISSTDSQIKGILVTGYGIYSEDIANEILEKLR
ncbi:MAG: phosphoribosylpyrophosphate synthetase [Bacteroidia bacterium]|nr:phosphoribosylpyrophosphate synthetase [Bacteroidia bacterium]